MGKFNMNIRGERERDTSGGGSGGGFPAEIFRPLPYKAGSKVSNKVIIPLFEPARWRMFNPTREMAERYNMVYNNDGLISIPEDLCTFYLKIPVHGINEFKRPDNTEGFSYVVCPNAMNNYLTKVLQYGPMFESGDCPWCNEEQKYWSIFNNRFEELGYTDETKKAMDNKEYNAFVDRDSVLRTARASAKSFRASERYIIPIFDHSKAIGVRKLDDGQTNVGHQFWMAPRSVFEKLANIFENGVEFFDTSSSMVPILTIIKDTTDCTQSNLMRTEYDVVSGETYEYSKEWLDYINDRDSMVDPTKFVYMASKSEMEFYIGNSEESNEEKKPTHSGVRTNPSQPNSPSSQAKPAAPSRPVAPNIGGPPKPVGSPVPPQHHTSKPSSKAKSPIPMSKMAGPPPMGSPSVETEEEAAEAPAGPSTGFTPNRNPPPGSPPPGRRAWD